MLTLRIPYSSYVARLQTTRWDFFARLDLYKKAARSREYSKKGTTTYSLAEKDKKKNRPIKQPRMTFVGLKAEKRSGISSHLSSCSFQLKLHSWFQWLLFSAADTLCAFEIPCEKSQNINDTSTDCRSLARASDWGRLNQTDSSQGWKPFRRQI